ncbi:transcriptional repressor [Candidatus Uhrbacteria bacterium]|nr:MAG: transcriptional repressor [Candidatus Uhrbacteria bacterium]
MSSCLRFGSRMTKAKRVFADIFDSAASPLSAADVLSAAAKRGVRADKTTAYRFLDRGVRAGELSEVEFGDGIKRYEHTHGAHHHHVVCVSCDAVVELDIESQLQRLIREAGVRTGFTIERHLVEFFGRCKACV